MFALASFICASWVEGKTGLWSGSSTPCGTWTTQPPAMSHSCILTAILLQTSGLRAMLTADAPLGGAARGSMEQWQEWLDQQTSTPVGQIIVFLLFVTIRLAFNEWSWRRRAKKHARRKEVSGG